ncbi:unnamed protein product [Pipistrellus nathusii]|uniref:HMG box domain-containing protein n=1 Tax=Pipistrellus nathusii TaxID=59473 RepID=A0ABP0AEG1_PIPNA
MENSKASVVPKGSPGRARKKFKRDEKELKSSQENDLWGDIRFRGEPEKPPMNAYQKFQRDVWFSEELQRMPPMKRMEKVGRLWHRVPTSQRELYEQQAEELQKQYKVDLDKWLETLSPEEYAAFTKRSGGKPKKMIMPGGLDPKIIRTEVQSPSARTLQEGLEQSQGPDPGMASSETYGDHSYALRGSEEKKEHEAKAESSSSSDSSSSSSDSSSSDEDDSSCSSSPPVDTSNSDSN